MIAITPLRRANHAGRMALVRHRLLGEAAPANPYRPGTKAHRYWLLGQREAHRLVDALMENARP